MSNNQNAGYVVRYTDHDNKGSFLVEDRSVNDTVTSLSFPGKGVTEYGKVIAENLLHILENFALPTEPRAPVEGQLWYDTSAGVDQLKIYNGTVFVPASGIYKSATSANITGTVTGDLWVDTVNQQLYLNTGSSWVLVGPQFAAGAQTGPRVEVLTATDNSQHSVLIFDVNKQPVIIISSTRFTPKVTIDGFFEIREGVNLSQVTTASGSMMFHGLTEAANSLKIGNKNVLASKFIRNDVNETMSGVLSVKNNQGINIGENSQLSLLAGERSLIRNNISGASTVFQVKSGPNNNTAISLVGSTNSTVQPKVGINSVNPQETLDVNGTLQVSDVLKVKATDDATAIDQGALRVSGGSSVSKSLYVGENIALAGSVLVDGNISGQGDRASPVTSRITGFSEIRANKFYGDLEGNNITVSGTITGTVSEAARLAHGVSFKLSGDVSAAQVTLTGAAGPAATLTTTISNGFVASKPSAATPMPDDQVLINRVGGPSPGLHKITQQELVSSIPTLPVGTIMPFAGVTAPPGWLLCDGSTVLRASYSLLFSVIEHRYLDTAELANRGLSSQLYFGLPDLRGRTPLGQDSMGGQNANRVTDLAADIVGNSSGVSTVDIKRSNLPDHEHDMRSKGFQGKQFYGINLAQGTPPAGTVNVVIGNQPVYSPYIPLNVNGFASSGAMIDGGQTGTNDYRTVAGEKLGAPVNVMNPYTTVSYIIWTGIV